MTALIKIDNRDSKKRAILKIKDSYTPDIRDFVNFLDSQGEDITLSGLKAYNRYLKGKPAGTRNKRLSAAKNRVRFLFYRSPEALDTAKTYRFEEALKKLKGEKKSKAIDKEALPTISDIKRLMIDIQVNKKDLRTLSVRLPLFIELLMFTGARVSELTGIKLTDCKSQGEYTEIRLHGKGGKERKVKVDTELIQRIQGTFKGQVYLFETSGGKKYYREYISNQIKKAGKRILGKVISAHTLRHIFATEALRGGWSPKKIAIQLGHSSVSTTLDLYCQDSPDYQDIKSLFEEQTDQVEPE